MQGGLTNRYFYHMHQDASTDNVALALQGTALLPKSGQWLEKSTVTLLIQ